MTAALRFLDSSQWRSLSVRETHLVYVYVELATPGHSTLMLSLCYRPPRDPATRNDDQSGCLSGAASGFWAGCLSLASCAACAVGCEKFRQSSATDRTNEQVTLIGWTSATAP